VRIVPFDASRVEALIEFFAQLPDRDLTFIKEDVSPGAVRSWSNAAQQWLALDGAVVTGYVAVRPLARWSDHVGELRLVVHPDRRRGGIGRALAQHALLEEVRAGRRKVVVELAADQEHAVAMFASIGFEGEALLRDHIRDREGRLRDLVMLAHFVDGTWAAMENAGITDELEALS
jgi:ribosomal protein S18 acetylase RimI-like enzyme